MGGGGGGGSLVSFSLWHAVTSCGDCQTVDTSSVRIFQVGAFIQLHNSMLDLHHNRAIHPSELVDASWMKEERKESSSPNLLKLNRFETKVSNWITKEIVYTENFEERVALVSRLIDIMEVWPVE